MKLNKFNIRLAIFLVLLIVLTGCKLPGLPSTAKGAISGRVLIPPTAKELSRDITGWVPAANAVVTIVDANGKLHTTTTDENGNYVFEGIAVKANTVVTAKVTVDGKTIILKDVIPSAVAADQNYDAGTMDPESTALALVVEELQNLGLPVNLAEIEASADFKALVGQVQEVLDAQGNVTTDSDISDAVADVAFPDEGGEPTPPGGDGGTPTYRPMRIEEKLPTFVVNVPEIFTVRTIPRDDVGKMVKAHFTLPDGATIEYQEGGVGDWISLDDVFGPAEGFPLADITTTFRGTFSAIGTYPVIVEFKQVSDDAVLGSKELTAEVYENIHDFTVISQAIKATFNVTDKNFETLTGPETGGGIVLGWLWGEGYGFSWEGNELTCYPLTQIPPYPWVPNAPSSYNNALYVIVVEVDEKIVSEEDIEINVEEVKSLDDENGYFEEERIGYDSNGKFFYWGNRDTGVTLDANWETSPYVEGIRMKLKIIPKKLGDFTITMWWIELD